MKFQPIITPAARLVVMTITALAATMSAATTVQLISAGAKSSAQFMIDGVKREARVGYFTDEGLILERVNDDTAIFRFNGLPQRMRLGEMVVVDSQTQGLISHQIRADQKDKYLTPALVNGGNLQAEIDRNADVMVIPVADADRLNLQYKDKKARVFQAPKVTIVETKDGKEHKTIIEPKDKDGKPLTYKTYALQLNSIRIGAVDVYGVSAIVSEKPGLTLTVVGRDFLKRLAPSWTNRTLTLVRR
jgi:aspartyl protease family protein